MSTPLIVSSAAGFGARDDDHFDDVTACGGWPANQYITKITRTKVSYNSNPSSISSIQTNYSRVGQMGDKQSVVNGQETSNIKNFPGDAKNKEVDLSADSFFVGMFGTVDNNSSPNLRQLGFITYDRKAGSVTSSELVPSAPKGGPSDNYRGFVTLGYMIGFAGTNQKSGGPVTTLSAYTVEGGIDDAINKVFPLPTN